MIVAAVALCACKKSAKPDESAGGSGETTHAGKSAGGAAPTLAWNDTEGDLDRQELPAVFADGSAVALVHHERGGGIVVATIDRTDHQTSSSVVISAPELKSLVDGGTGNALPGLAPKLDAGDKWLAHVHAEHSLVRMKPLAMAKADSVTDQTKGTHKELSVEWKDDKLTVRRRGDELFSRPTPESWKSPDHANCPGCAAACPKNQAFFDRGWIDDEHSVAVIYIGYGVDPEERCDEPSDQIHVITW